MAAATPHSPHVLVTRPAHQAQPLLEALRASGARPFLYATLDIVTAPPPSPLPQFPYDWWFFISPNAVTHGLQALAACKVLNKNQPCAAVGAGTANALYAQGMQQVFYPPSGVGARALLDAWQALPHPTPHPRILIFKGQEGNPLLETELTAQGAHIDTWICYNRVETVENSDLLLHALENDPFTALIGTSGAGLQALLKPIPIPWRSQLLNTPLIVVSPRLRHLAHELGFKHVWLAADASETALVQALKQAQILC